MPDLKEYLAKIDSFGGTDADQDPLLMRCFEEHDAFHALVQHKRFCVVGRKGSGKTAIFKKLLTDHRWKALAFGHTFTDYPWYHHEKQKASGVPDEECYLHSWKYLCLLTIAKILLNQDNSQPYSESSLEDVARLEKFVIDTYGSRNPDVTQIFTPGRELRFSGEFGFDWKIFKAGTKVESVRIEDLPLVIQEVNKNLREITVKSLNPDLDYYVMFDQLDLGFTKEKRDYSDRLIGLLLAAKELNTAAREAGKKLTISIFLRDDIYDYLQFEDKNKITENFTSYVIWDGKDDKHTLKSMMERRFRDVFENSEVTWDDVFDEEHGMPGRQKKYNYIVDRTFLRPRDMIKFCNEVLKKYKSSNGDSTKFNNDQVSSAQREYSDYLYRELDDEIHKHMPDYREIFEVVKAMDSLQFTTEDFREAWEAKKNLFQPDRTPDSALRQLFEFSVIGYLNVGGGGGGAQYIWHYKDSRTRFNEAAEKLRVHPGFKDVLGLKKYTWAEG